MNGLDFWATDEWTDARLPWSTNLVLREWVREVTRDEIIFALSEVTHGHDE